MVKWVNLQMLAYESFKETWKLNIDFCDALINFPVLPTESEINCRYIYGGP